MVTRLGTAVVVVWATLLLLFIGLHRLVAGDEAFYTLAIRLVSEGKTPYRDFFYPQMPLLPYIYAGISSAFGKPDWQILRIIASLGAAATTYAVFWFLLSYTTWSIAAGSVVLLVTSPLFFPWAITIETYSLTAPLLLISVLITEILRKQMLTREATPKDTSLTILAGLSLSIATQTRLYSVALLPILYLYTPHKLRIWYLLSFTGGCIPAIGMFIADPHRFWFNNLGYHLLRAHGATLRQIKDKVAMLLILLGVTPSLKFVGLNTALLFWGGTIGAINLIQKIPVIALASLALMCISFVPTPTYFQYFSLVAPFWAIICGVQIFQIIETPIGHRLLLRTIFPVCLALISLIGFSTNLDKYLHSGDGVMGIPKWSNPTDFTLKATEQVTQKINARFGPNDIIFTNWNGYLLNAQAKPLPGSENVFGIRTATRFPKLSEKMHLSSHGKILHNLEKGNISGIVLRIQFERINARIALAISKKCSLVEEIAGTRIYDCRKN